MKKYIKTITLASIITPVLCSPFVASSCKNEPKEVDEQAKMEKNFDDLNNEVQKDPNVSDENKAKVNKSITELKKAIKKIDFEKLDKAYKKYGNTIRTTALNAIDQQTGISEEDKKKAKEQVTKMYDEMDKKGFKNGMLASINSAYTEEGKKAALEALKNGDTATFDTVKTQLETLSNALSTLPTD